METMQSVMSYWYRRALKSGLGVTYGDDLLWGLLSSVD